ncbi:MAG: hypothetical protein Q9168_002362 [Polycauliona sp. 1 TL-2023]
MAEPSYPSEDVTDGVFSFGSTGLHVDGFCRASPKFLRRILFPEFLASDEAIKSACAKAARIIGRDWIIAQLQHYGIAFSLELTDYKAKALLVTCVAHGLCDAVPPQVSRINASLQEQYEAQVNHYHSEMEAYRAQELPKRVAKFESCGTPTAEAGCDASLFVRKYFLDDRGQPDKAKTPHLILLPGYHDKGLALRGKTDRIPALHVADAGFGGAATATVIGWDRERVNSQAEEINTGCQVVRAGNYWNTQMRKHEEFKKKLPNRQESYDAIHPFTTLGVYAIRCEAVERASPILGKGLKLRIVRRGCLAVFDLGIMTGVMVFAETTAKVEKIIAAGRITSPIDDGGFQDAYQDDDIASDDDGLDRSHHPRRRYLQWRGYNTRTGELQHHASNHNTGYIDFQDAQAMTFRGVLDHDRDLGGEVEFQGYRLPGMSGPLTMNWDALSHLESDRAKVPKHVW